MSNTAKVLLIVVIVVLLVCGGLVTLLVVGGNKLMNWAMSEMAEEQEWQNFAGTWRAPSVDTPAEKLFPKIIGEFALAAQDEQAGIPALNVALAGRHGVYQSNNQTVEVYAWRASTLEREAIYKRVTDSIKGGGGVHSLLQINARLRYSSTQLGEQGVFWGDGQWLFLARSTSKEDLEPFLRSYLQSISDKAPSADATKPAASSPVAK
jgi:hypothetical protein